MMYGIRVKDVMTRNPVVIGKGISVKSAATILDKYKIGALIVVDRAKHVEGILTEGDIVRKGVAKGLSPAKVSVGELMTKNVVVVSPDDDLSKISKIMAERHLRRVPVVEKDKLVGYVSERDLLKLQPSLIDILSDKLKAKRSGLRLGYRVV